MEGGVCRECDEGQYGINCASVCSCEEGYHCDPVDGFCTCRKGVADASCQPLNSSCSGVGRGRLCSNMTCNYACVNGQKCNHHTNMCECPLDWRDDSGGTCNFLPGCPDGYFGPSCNQLCRCEHNATCDALGACECPAGWSGLTCGDPCEPWYYGSNCSRTCDCPEEALECSPIDGSCSCPPGFYGLNCSRECPDGYFGSNCRNVCSCDNLTETCDRLDGACKAKKGPPPSSAGPNPRDPGGRSSSATGAVIGSVIAGVVLVGLIVALVFFLQHRRKQGKENRTDALSISPYVCYNTAAAAKDEYTELEERRYCGNTYAEAIDTFKSNPRHCIVGGATYAIPEKPNPPPDADAGDVKLDEDYSHLDRAVITPPTANALGKEHDYDALGLTAPDSGDQYSHLERNQRAASMRSAEDADRKYGSLLQSGEHEGEYSNLDRKTGRSQEKEKDYGNQYEVVRVE
ncbi:multiple epidermal growth factor-like domains protein 10 [Acanthaster planci]|uniref:Multiple epidermal growth factor-like domains protein 10 n=1 Tax=Acanthaster planci TaxID=133434 RepID=A0A8B7XUM9_ACAPL|nr:multiple epidermal growth factor-like domains protein 10 [Acanthaster planci]